MVAIVLATLLDEQHLGTLRAFLERDVSGNLFGLSVLEGWGVRGLSGAEWWGVFDTSDEITGACYAASLETGVGFDLVVPVGTEEASRLMGIALAARGGASWVVGDRLSCDALWDGLGGHPARLRSDQVLFEVTDIQPGSALDVRLGEEQDFEWLYRASSEMVREDLALPWGGRTEEDFAARVHASIRAKAEYLGSFGGQRVYRAKRGARCSYGAQIGGIWVEPSFRGQGIGRSGTRALTATLLADSPRVSLHVRADNEVAIRCYESIGYQPVRAFRLLVR